MSPKKDKMEENVIEVDQTVNNEIGVLEFQEINDDEKDIMKGDAIGDTLYSAKWILKTLISLTKVHENGWNSSTEDDLCMLWDMTSEKDIVDFLLDNDFFKIAEFTLKISEEPRLMEIIIGIIGNLCCEKRSLETLARINSLVDIILSFITSHDKETLIQVLRILHAAAWDIKIDPHSLWLKKIEEFKILSDAVIFILKSSTSDELLSPCIDFVYLISEIELLNEENFFKIIFNDVDQLILSLCESMNELINQKECIHTEAQFKNIENWLNILFNIIKNNLLIFSNEETDEKFEKIDIVVLKILQPFENISNLIPMEDTSFTCIQKCIKMVSTFQKNELYPSSALIQTILQIMVNLKKGVVKNEFEDCENSKALCDYIVDYWIDTVKILNKCQVLKILEPCDHETINTIVEIIKSIPDISENGVTELLQKLNL